MTSSAKLFLTPPTPPRRPINGVCERLEVKFDAVSGKLLTPERSGNLSVIAGAQPPCEV